jgi:hypothetical protein
MRAETDTETAALIGHGIEIPLERIQIDHKCGCIDFGEGCPNASRRWKRHGKIIPTG